MPASISVAATVDQRVNLLNAFGNMGVPVLVYSGHRLNSATCRGIGISGSIHADGGGTSKNRHLTAAINRASAMILDFCHLPANRDASKGVELGVSELEEELRLSEQL